MGLGIVAFVLGGRRNDAPTRRAGVIALAYTAVAVVIFVIAGATS